jgi:anti-anti-sigma factor
MPIPSDRPNVKLEQTEAGVVAHLVHCTALDEQSTPAIEEQLLGLAGELGSGHLLLDLSGIHYASSIALGMMITVRQKLRTAGGRLTLTGVADEIYDVLDATRLTRLLDIRKAPPA